MIKPSTMVVAMNRKDLERIRKELAQVLKIQAQDITFTFKEVEIKWKT